MLMAVDAKVLVLVHVYLDREVKEVDDLQWRKGR
jgi:hypothetical protein